MTDAVAWRNDLSTPGRRFRTWLDMLFKDHQVLRLAYSGRYRLSDRMWRAAQPAPFQLRQVRDMGIRTVINLRGARDCGSYVLEREACDRLGLTLVDFPVNSRAAPKKEYLRGAVELFRAVEYPAVMHCKSGADRAGLMSTLYLFAHEGRPLDEAMRQLHWSYGHFKQSKTGIIDFFFETYRDYNARTPIDFMTWVEEVYDPDALKAAFHAQWWWSAFVDKVLRRE